MRTARHTRVFQPHDYCLYRVATLRVKFCMAKMNKNLSSEYEVEHTGHSELKC